MGGGGGGGGGGGNGTSSDAGRNGTAPSVFATPEKGGMVLPWLGLGLGLVLELP